MGAAANLACRNLAEIGLPTSAFGGKQRKKVFIFLWNKMILIPTLVNVSLQAQGGYYMG